MFEAIPSVSGGITLIAFLGACYLVYLRARLKQQRELVDIVPNRDKFKTVLSLLEYVYVDTANLADADKMTIILAQADPKAERQRSLIICVFCVTLIAAAITIYSVYHAGVA